MLLIVSSIQEEDEAPHSFLQPRQNDPDRTMFHIKKTRMVPWASPNAVTNAVASVK